jgi:hypothetical protein
LARCEKDTPTAIPEPRRHKFGLAKNNNSLNKFQEAEIKYINPAFEQL